LWSRNIMDSVPCPAWQFTSTQLQKKSLWRLELNSATHTTQSWKGGNRRENSSLSLPNITTPRSCSQHQASFPTHLHSGGLRSVPIQSLHVLPSDRHNSQYARRPQRQSTPISAYHNTLKLSRTNLKRNIHLVLKPLQGLNGN